VPDRHRHRLRAELPDHQQEGATIASTVTYLLPVIAITLLIVAGIILVLIGVALTRNRNPARAH
jgi:predicted small integral membrane protein